MLEMRARFVLTFFHPIRDNNQKEIAMFSKKMLMSAISVLGVVFALSLCIGFSGSIAMAACPDDALFTTDFRLEDCKFKDKGENPYFILKPGYQVVLESVDDDDLVEERSVETVLRDKKTIYLDDDGSKGKGRKIKTRVVEERAWERNEDGELVLVEISRNWFAICKKTNAVYYFGELSKDCTLGDDEAIFPIESTGGFDPNDETRCADGSLPNTEGSWEAGQPPMDNEDGEIAKPGLIMPGTALLNAKYFQEIAPPNAVDRGEIVAMGLDWPEELDEGEEPEFTGCIKTLDTNPAKEECGDDDVKIYCPGVGLVQDQDLELVSYGYGDDDDDDDDDDNDRRWRWGKR